MWWKPSRSDEELSPIFFGEFDATERRTLLRSEPAVLTRWKQVPRALRDVRQTGLVPAIHTVMSLLNTNPALMRGVSPDCRIICGFRMAPAGARTFDAGAGRVEALGKVQPTYRIFVNIDGLPIVQLFTIRLIALTLRDSGLASLGFARTEAMRKDVFVGTLAFVVVFMFFHELGHVVNGHLHWRKDDPHDRRSEACRHLDVTQPSVRRMIECDADWFAVGMLANYLLHQYRAGDVAAATDVTTLYTLGLIALYVSFGLHTDDFAKPTDDYHAPATRLFGVEADLRTYLALSDENSGRSLQRLLDLLRKSDAHRVFYDPDTHRNDQQAWKQTHELHARCRQLGCFRSPCFPKE